MRRRVIKSVLRLALPLVCCVAICESALAEDIGGTFADAVEHAQKRTVKLYGASIGRVSGFATGIVVSDDGKIVTAQGIHLSSHIRVTLPDGTMHNAKVLSSIDRLQLALLKIDTPTPDYFELTDKPIARKGDWILAVSNAFKVADGAEPLSVNLGVVSLRTRLDVRRGVQDFAYDGDVLLIDAITSNPGAAGGAIVTADQRLVGMIGKVIESTSTNTRLNYAVPSDLVAQFVAGKISESSDTGSIPLAKADLGIRLFRLGGRKAPAYIDRVQPGSPAAKAKLRSDDLIVSIDGQAVRDASTFEEIIDTLKPGEEITIVVKRRNQVLPIQITPIAKEE